MIENPNNSLRIKKNEPNVKILQRMFQVQIVSVANKPDKHCQYKQTTTCTCVYTKNKTVLIFLQTVKRIEQKTFPNSYKASIRKIC